MALRSGSRPGPLSRIFCRAPGRPGSAPRVMVKISIVLAKQTEPWCCMTWPHRCMLGQANVDPPLRNFELSAVCENPCWALAQLKMNVFLQFWRRSAEERPSAIVQYVCILHWEWSSREAEHRADGGGHRKSLRQVNTAINSLMDVTLTRGEPTLLILSLHLCLLIASFCCLSDRLFNLCNLLLQAAPATVNIALFIFIYCPLHPPPHPLSVGGGGNGLFSHSPSPSAMLWQPIKNWIKCVICPWGWRPFCQMFDASILEKLVCSPSRAPKGRTPPSPLLTEINGPSAETWTAWLG